MLSVPWINLLAWSLFLECICCCFIVHLTHLPPYLLFIECICYLMYCSLNTLLFIEYFCSHGHFFIAYICCLGQWMHALPWSLFHEFICCHNHCSLNTFFWSLFLKFVFCHVHCALNTFAVLFIIHWIRFLSWSLLLQYICFHIQFVEYICFCGHCYFTIFAVILTLHHSFNTFAVILIFHWIHLLSYILFLEYICCHRHCSWNIFAVLVIVRRILLLSWSLFIEYVFCYTRFHCMRLLSYLFFLEHTCCYIHCSLNTFSVIVIVHGIHFLSYSLFIEYIAVIFTVT